MFDLREINQIEREMCSYLAWELTVDNAILANFQAMVKGNFRGPGPYPTYSLHMVSKKANSTNNATTASGGATITQPIPPPSGTSTSPIPSFGQRNRSPPIPVLPPLPSSATSLSTASSNDRSSSAAAISHTQYPRLAHHHAPPLLLSLTAPTTSTVSILSSVYGTPPATPDTASSCNSTSTSPAYSPSTGIENNSARIAGSVPGNAVHHHHHHAHGAGERTPARPQHPHLEAARRAPAQGQDLRIRHPVGVVMPRDVLRRVFVVRAGDLSPPSVDLLSLFVMDGDGTDGDDPIDFHCS
jgi:hypothetical protein